jgi:hypothetical protein|tara:strand:+ start:704 stop:1054 length:351 start_codon:yes stop_codon:yes gene_type:complete
MSFYNTTNETGATLKASHHNAVSQEDKIFNYFLTHNKHFSPSMILKQMNLNCPITSIRRAFTNLTINNKLIKTTNYSVGDYGKREHLWKLKTENEYNETHYSDGYHDVDNIQNGTY